MGIEDAEIRSAAYIEELRRVIQKRPQVKIFETRRHFCNDLEFSMTKGGEILYRDNGHLNLIGSRCVGKILVENTLGHFD